MFNSQKINTDPKPYVTYANQHRTELRNAEWDIQSDGEVEYVRVYDPRPEFDNNPNPILLDLRDYWWHMGIDKPDADCARIYLESTAIERVAGGSTRHIAHAKKVLERLARLTGEEV